jgi:5'-deoxynucleotidase YfbR-like HD superfamily hydrolase
LVGIVKLKIMDLNYNFENQSEYSLPEGFTLPEYLLPYVEATKNVPRYLDPSYPDGMIQDTLYDHLCRLTYLALQLDLDEISKQELIRIIWIHDLPEIRHKDIPSTIKGPEADELEFVEAEKILSTEDFALYERYKTASTFCKGKSTEIPDKVALISKVLDLVEGNMYFHYHLHRWIMAGNTELPSENAQTYTFATYDSYMEILSFVDDRNLIRIPIEILDFEIKYIKGLWEGHEDQAPNRIKSHVNNISRIIP